MSADRPMSAARRRVLLTVSGTIPADLDDQIGRGDRPRPDYLVMAETFGADLIDHVRARDSAGRLGRIIERLAGPNVLLAWSCFRQRRRYEVVFTDGEQVGIPYAAMTRLAGRGGARHIMIVHILTVRKKMALMRALRLKVADRPHGRVLEPPTRPHRDHPVVPVGPHRPVTVHGRYDVLRARCRRHPPAADDLLGGARVPGLPDDDRGGARARRRGDPRRRQPVVEAPRRVGRRRDPGQRDRRPVRLRRPAHVVRVGRVRRGAARRHRLPGGDHDDPRSDGDGQGDHLHEDSRAARRHRRRIDRDLRRRPAMRCPAHRRSSACSTITSSPPVSAMPPGHGRLPRPTSRPTRLGWRPRSTPLPAEHGRERRQVGGSANPASIA